MIDLHTHTLLSDGALIPSELVRRAMVKGYEIIGLTDHVDSSNIDFVLPRLIKVASDLNKVWGEKIKVIPGVELTHVPLQLVPELITYARNQGNVLVIVHGESPVEPVIEGTNEVAIESGADILAHPGWIDENLARLAKRNGVYLELTARNGHNKANKHVLEIARCTEAPLVFNTDAHEPDDLMPERQFKMILEEDLNMTQKEIEQLKMNAYNLAARFIK
ncbi:MAG TPA: histidinol phosphate phosphatase domain-containing protein [Candidatus Omnitrophica bacterium]|nr:histidinol phosphate phosphatase domain-containing protein [Candidatus Omnitrophota bacterium]